MNWKIKRQYPVNLKVISFLPSIVTTCRIGCDLVVKAGSIRGISSSELSLSQLVRSQSSFTTWTQQWSNKFSDILIFLLVDYWLGIGVKNVINLVGKTKNEVLCTYCSNKAKSNILWNISFIEHKMYCQRGHNITRDLNEQTVNMRLYSSTIKISSLSKIPASLNPSFANPSFPVYIWMVKWNPC